MDNHDLSDMVTMNLFIHLTSMSMLWWIQQTRTISMPTTYIKAYLSMRVRIADEMIISSCFASGAVQALSYKYDFLMMQRIL